MMGGQGTIPFDMLNKLRSYTTTDVYNNLVGYFGKNTTASMVKETGNFLPDIRQIGELRTKTYAAEGNIANILKAQIPSLKTSIDDIIKNRLPQFESRLTSIMDGKIGLFDGRIKLLEGKLSPLDWLPGHVSLVHGRVGELYGRVREVADCVDNRAISFVMDTRARTSTLTGRLTNRMALAKDRIRELKADVKDLQDRFGPVNMYKRVFQTRGSTYEITGTNVFGWPADKFGPETSEGLADSFRISSHALAWIESKIAVPADQKAAARRYIRSQLQNDISNLLINPMVQQFQELIGSLSTRVENFAAQIESMVTELESVRTELTSDIGLKPRCVLAAISGPPNQPPIGGGSIGIVGGGPPPSGGGPIGGGSIGGITPGNGGITPGTGGGTMMTQEVVPGSSEIPMPVTGDPEYGKARPNKYKRVSLR